MSNDDGVLNKGLKSIQGVAPQKPSVDIKVRERKIEGDSEQNRKLRGIGVTLERDGFVHAGSIGIHIYKHPLSMDMIVISQNCIDENLNATEVNYAIHKTSIDVARSFGWEPSKKQAKSIIKEG